MSRLLPFLDALERAVWTFVQAFAGSIVVTGGVGMNDAKIAGVAAALAVAKSLSIATTVRTGEELSRSGAAEANKRG